MKMSMTKSLHWDITKSCNLRCKHCYNAEKYFNEQSDVYIENEMNLEQCIRTVEYFSSAGFGHIHFLGGEPLASPYIFDVIKRAKELGMIITINSNACLLTADIQQKLIDLGVDQFAASLDGCTAIVNDSIRGNGTFEKVVSNMKQLNEQIKRNHSPLETVLVFTLTKKNLHELILLPSLAEEIGVNLITLTTFIESGQGQKNHDEFQIDFNTICDAINLMVSQELTKHRIPLQIDMRPRFCEYLSAVYNAPVIYNLKNSLCCAGEDVWYLEANGNVHPCLIFQLESGKLALHNNVYQKETININSTEIENIKKSEYWNTFIHAKHNFKTEKIPTCGGCRYVDECQPCFLDYGEYNRSIMECEWTKRKEKLLFEKISETKINISVEVQFDDKNCVLTKAGEPLLILDTQISNDIWTLIKEDKRPKSIFELLMQEYEVNEDVLKYDIAAFLFTLNGNGIIEFCKENKYMNYKKKENLVCEQIDDEIIVFDTDVEQFYEFDGVGSFIWNIMENTNLENIAQCVCDEYDVGKEIALVDITTFFEDLLEKNLIYRTEDE